MRKAMKTMVVLAIGMLTSLSAMADVPPGLPREIAWINEERASHVLDLHRIGFEIFPELGFGIRCIEWVGVSVLILCGVALVLWLVRQDGVRRLGGNLWRGIRIHQGSILCAIIVLGCLYFCFPFDSLCRAGGLTLRTHHRARELTHHTIGGGGCSPSAVAHIGDERKKAAHDAVQKAVDELILKLKEDYVAAEAKRRRVGIHRVIDYVSFPVPAGFTNDVTAVCAAYRRASAPYEWESPSWRRKEWTEWTTDNEWFKEDPVLERLLPRLRDWQISREWMPKEMRSETALVRKCLADSLKLRLQCMGIPIEWVADELKLSFGCRKKDVESYLRDKAERRDQRCDEP